MRVTYPTALTLHLGVEVSGVDNLPAAERKRCPGPRMLPFSEASQQHTQRHTIAGDEALR